MQVFGRLILGFAAVLALAVAPGAPAGAEDSPVHPSDPTSVEWCRWERAGGPRDNGACVTGRVNPDAAASSDWRVCAAADGLGACAFSAGNGYVASAPGACTFHFDESAKSTSVEHCANAEGCAVRGVAFHPSDCDQPKP